jgi:hypothetical protein
MIHFCLLTTPHNLCATEPVAGACSEQPQFWILWIENRRFSNDLPENECCIVGRDRSQPVPTNNTTTTLFHIVQYQFILSFCNPELRLSRAKWRNGNEELGIQCSTSILSP